MSSERDGRQRTVSEWAEASFGREQTTNLEQRGLRLLEEAIEAAQACGCDKEQLHRLVDYVYSRPVGELSQELGGVGICLLVLANAAKMSADDTELVEVCRILQKPTKFFSQRNEEKNKAGFKARGLNEPLG